MGLDSHDGRHLRSGHWIVCASVCVLLVAQAFSQAAEQTEATYAEAFQREYPPVQPAPTMDQYASPALYDQRFMGEALDDLLTGVDRDGGALSYSLAPRLQSLNEMARATGDVKYLDAAYRCVRAVMALRDDARGQALATGQTAPVWGSARYAKRGWSAHLVHTGLIVTPILDFLRLARQNAAFMARLGDEDIDIYAKLQQSLDYFDREWTDGPEPDEGYYCVKDEEEDDEGRPQAANRLGAFGQALWLSWKLGGNPHHRDRALALGRYMKNRIPLTEDGTAFWTYQLANKPITARLKNLKAVGGGESVAQGASTMAFPVMLALDGQVFDAQDIGHFTKTALEGFARRTDGILFGQLCGLPNANPKGVRGVARWLILSPSAPAIYERISAYYLNYDPKPDPLEMALLIRYGRK